MSSLKTCHLANESVSRKQDLMLNDGTGRAPVPIDHEAPEAAEEAPRKSAWTRAWTDPDAPTSEPSTKQN